MGKGHRYQGANQADRWRRRAGRRRPSRRLPRPLLGLIFLGVGTLAAAVTQFAIQSTAGQQNTSGLQSTITNWTEPLPGPMEGRASVIDGDTVEIAGQRIRFNGIDAPESRQHCDDAKGFDYPCGRRAPQALDKFLAASRPLRCSFVDRDQYGRLVGNCNRADGRSVQKWLVEQGLALDWPRYSNGAFDNASTHDWTAFVHLGPFVSHAMSSSAAPSTWLTPWRMQTLDAQLHPGRVHLLSGISSVELLRRMHVRQVTPMGN
ncbi:thermonuclease family protein [Mesorhizobium sp.]|uniref:thermonuclease family protein n=1 Tax=Mesorhizobium sp. TaxID=1871066 RepID=UPI00257D5124|nr:thermonuclease family protein [Mesorhizobium sp.]